MEAAHFDALSRALSGRYSRRGVVRAFASVALVGLGGERATRKATATSSGGCGSDAWCAAMNAVGQPMPNGSVGTHLAQDSGQWVLTFDDSFDGGALASEIWRTRFPWGRDRSAVGEGQWYVRDDLERGDFYQVADGRLRIVGDRCTVPSEGGHEYCSGLISTHSSFAQEYGYFEIRARAPYGQGLWPACWLLPVDGSWPWEIDIFEILGHDPTTVHMNIHYANAHGEPRTLPGSFSGPDFSQDYHTFAVDWSPDWLVWYVDGVERHRVGRDAAIPYGPYYLIANLAVGGDWPGYPDETTPFPAYFDIDYIRVFSR